MLAGVAGVWPGDLGASPSGDDYVEDFTLYPRGEITNTARHNLVWQVSTWPQLLCIIIILIAPRLRRRRYSIVAE